MPVQNWNGNPAVGTTIGGWKFLGCQSEINGRLLRGTSYTNAAGMTIEACQAYCAKNNFGFAGVEYGQECYCGSLLSRGNTISNPPKCDMACKGSGLQTCGGSNALSVFNNTAFRGSQPPAKVGTWSYVSCFMEPQTGRALPDKLWSDPGMTAAKCTQYCQDAGYAWAGLEYGTECWCGKGLTQGLQDASDPGCAMQCNMQCGGDGTQICGGAGAVTVYKAANAKRAEKRSPGREGEATVTTRRSAGKPAGGEGIVTKSGRFVKVRRDGDKKGL
jgi:hypothetical protein